MNIIEVMGNCCISFPVRPQEKMIVTGSRGLALKCLYCEVAEKNGPLKEFIYSLFFYVFKKATNDLRLNQSIL